MKLVLSLFHVWKSQTALQEKLAANQIDLHELLQTTNIPPLVFLSWDLYNNLHEKAWKSITIFTMSVLILHNLSPLDIHSSCDFNTSNLQPNASQSHIFHVKSLSNHEKYKNNKGIFKNYRILRGKNENFSTV